MKLTTYVVGYGNELTQGRGIYQLSIDNRKVAVNLVFACAEKPGAIILVGHQMLMSFKAVNEAGLYRFDLNHATPFATPDRYVLPYFITAWSQGVTSKTLLGSSFYDGVDVLVDIKEAPVVTSVIQHQYRIRSQDLRQTSPHPHHICLLPGSAFACSADMGIDAVSLLEVTPDALTLINDLCVDAPMGDGPRILRIDRKGRFAYLLNEISNTVSVFAIQYAEGKREPIFREIQRLSVVLNTEVKNSPAGCWLTADERYLLVTNRGENTVALYTVDAELGILKESHRVTTGATPRDVSMLGDYVLVAAQAANTLQLFELEANQHRLTLCDECSDIAAPVAFIVA